MLLELGPVPHDAPVPIRSRRPMPPFSLVEQLDSGQWEVHVYSPSLFFPISFLSLRNDHCPTDHGFFLFAHHRLTFDQCDLDL